MQPLPLGAGVAPPAATALAVGLAVRMLVVANVDLLPALGTSPCAAVRVPLGLIAAERRKRVDRALMLALASPAPLAEVALNGADRDVARRSLGHAATHRTPPAPAAKAGQR